MDSHGYIIINSSTQPSLKIWGSLIQSYDVLNPHSGEPVRRFQAFVSWSQQPANHYLLIIRKAELEYVELEDNTINWIEGFSKFIVLKDKLGSHMLPHALSPSERAKAQAFHFLRVNKNKQVDPEYQMFLANISAIIFQDPNDNKFLLSADEYLEWEAAQ